MRAQIEDLPLIRSTSTSSTARCRAACSYFFFHRSNPANAASSWGEFATTMSGIFVLGFLVVVLAEADLADLARDGATRGASPSILRKCGGHGASPRPADSSRAASSSRASSEPGVSSIVAWGSPNDARRAGIVATVKSAGSQWGISSQCSGAETRASGSGRTEYAEQVVRSFAFWL